MIANLLSVSGRPEIQQPKVVPAANQACAFCRIVRGGTQAAVVFEDDISLAFLDQRPLFPGHCLIVPKGHYPTLVDLPRLLLSRSFGQRPASGQSR